LVSGENEERIIESVLLLLSNNPGKGKGTTKNGNKAPVQRLREYDREIGNTNPGR
jgi:hypothetical protein